MADQRADRVGAIATLAYVIHHVRGRARQREPPRRLALPTARFEPVPFASKLRPNLKLWSHRWTRRLRPHPSSRVLTRMARRRLRLLPRPQTLEPIGWDRSSCLRSDGSRPPFWSRSPSSPPSLRSRSLTRPLLRAATPMTRPSRSDTRLRRGSTSRRRRRPPRRCSRPPLERPLRRPLGVSGDVGAILAEVLARYKAPSARSKSPAAVSPCCSSAIPADRRNLSASGPRVVPRMELWTRR